MDARLAELMEHATLESDAFEARHEKQLSAYRAAVGQGLEDALRALRVDVHTLSSADAFCDTMLELAAEYVLWLRWTLFDLPIWAIVLGTPLPDFRERAAAVALVYQSIRILDDVLDTHLTYKGLHSTLLGSARTRLAQDETEASGLPTHASLLVSVLLSVEGLRRLASLSGSDDLSALVDVLEAYRRTVVGAILEYSSASSPATQYLTRLIDLKNVSYTRILTSALQMDKAKHQPLLTWIDELHVLSQQLNDLNDLQRDVLNGQPNFIWEFLKARQLSDTVDISLDRIEDSRAVAAVEHFYGEALLKLGSGAHALSGEARAAAMAKWHDVFDYARFLGLFLDSDGAEESGIRIV